MKPRWVLPALVSGLLSLGLLGLVSWSGCSAQQAGALQPTGAHGITTPLGSPEPAISEPLDVPRDALDLERFSPILLEPDFAEVARAKADDRHAEAADRFAALLAEQFPERKDQPLYLLQLARLQERAGRSREALQSYRASAEADWPLRDYASYFAGRLALGTGDPQAASSLLDGVREDTPLPLALHRGEAAFLLGDTARAVRELRSFLGKSEHPDGWVRASLLLARALGERAAGTGPEPSLEDRLEALGLARRVAVETAGSSSAAEAVELEQRILAALPPAEFERHRGLAIEDQLVRLEALVNARRWDDASWAADELLGNATDAKQRHGIAACEARLLKGKVLAGQRKWGLAVDGIEELLRFCEEPDLRARALYLAGRYATSDKRYSQATRLYAKLEKESPRHRLADDARLLGAKAYLELGDVARFTTMLNTIAEDYPDGDLSLDGSFDLSLLRMERGDWSGAANVLERGLAVATRADARRDHEFAGRERYFHARALIETGERDRGLEGLEELIRDCPLSYYMQHAYWRLSDHDAVRARAALDQAIEATRRQPFGFSWRPEFDTAAFQRALQLFLLSEVELAEREIETLGLLVEQAAPELLWAVALIYGRVGLDKRTQAVLRGRLTEWLGRWPVGDWRKAWELAFPRPYHPIVQQEAARQELPEALIFAVMREESLFDPRAVSHANAFGLMQLIEPTAKHYARELGMPYSRAGLLNPKVNIALGSKVLRSYRDQFPHNPLLAIAGYNAGPSRPKRWLKERPHLDFDVWVELIPFRETRRYMKRVLASRGAYTVLYEADDADWSLPIKFGG